jgi:hypothetical protein
LIMAATEAAAMINQPETGLKSESELCSRRTVTKYGP